MIHGSLKQRVLQKDNKPGGEHSLIRLPTEIDFFSSLSPRACTVCVCVYVLLVDCDSFLK